MGELLDTIVEAGSHADRAVEIIVVDDSSGAEARRVEAKCSESSARYLRGPRSASLKRNLAAQEASHPLLFFVDSDCLVTPDTIAAHLRAIDGAPLDVAGVVGLIEMHGELAGVWSKVEGSQFHNPCFDFAHRYLEVGWGTTANLLVRREVFFEVGGFSADSYTLVGGEDVDLGIRVVAAGYRWVTDQNALVLHRRDPITRVSQVLHRLFTYGRADVYLAGRFPERRSLFPNPYSVGLATLLTLAALRGRAVWIALPAALLAAAGVVAEEARRRQGSTSSIYGDRASNPEDRPDRSLLYHLKGAAIDSGFDAGITWEALRRGRPLGAFARFDYVDDCHFVPREHLNRK